MIKLLEVGIIITDSFALAYKWPTQQRILKERKIILHGNVDCVSAL